MLISPEISLILASKSPRRSYLLRQAGINFTIRTAEVEEIYPPDLPVDNVAPYLAKLKAQESKHLLQEDAEVLLTADSVVIHDEKIYGKPRDRTHAVETLLQLSASMHTVITGCCLMSSRHQVVFSSKSFVYLDEMSLQEIEYYVDTYQPYDKAGAYAIQEWVGLAKIRRIEGTYPNIMGLPVNLVYEHLINWPIKD